MSHNSLQNYYATTFGFKTHHNWDIETIENLMPFELQIYTTLMVQHVEEENERIRQQQGN